jgi:hypothetical protein
MKGAQFNLAFVIILLAVLLIIGVVLAYFVKGLPIRSYLAPMFEPCGQTEGSLCCNLDNPDIEPFCGGGMECDIKADPNSNLDLYKQSTCVLYETKLTFMTDQMVYDDSCKINNKGDYSKDCEPTIISGSYLIDYLNMKAGGIGDSDQNCTDAYTCSDCTRYFGFGAAESCYDCESCDPDTGNCSSCAECSRSKDAAAGQEFSQCYICDDCAQCAIDASIDSGSCKTCDSCYSCSNTDIYSKMNYCKESDICNSTTCFNNFYCGKSKSDYNEDMTCKVCKRTPETKCTKTSDYSLCEAIKSCFSEDPLRSDAC